MGGNYARGHNALGICERCSKKMLRRKMVYDGQYPDLLVCPECWDPKHPQEYLPPVTDPVTIYDPTGDPDKAQANVSKVTWPPLPGSNGMLAIDPAANPLQVGIVVNAAKFNVITGPTDGVGEIPGPQLVGDAGGNVITGTATTARPPLPGAGADPDDMGSIEEGNLMIIVATQRDSTSSQHHTIDNGWSRLWGNRQSQNTQANVFYKIATASEVAPTISWSGASGGVLAWAAQTFAYSNNDQDVPFGNVFDWGDLRGYGGNPAAAEVGWLIPRSRVQAGDKVVAIFFDGNNGNTTPVYPTPTTQLMNETDPTINVGHWEVESHMVQDNLLGQSGYSNPFDGATLDPVTMTVEDFTYQGAFAKILEYNATAEATWAEWTATVESGKTYWIGVSCGSHQASGDPDHAWVSVDDGTENGFIYENVDTNANKGPGFGNDIGTPDEKITFGWDTGRGTMAFLRYDASADGTVTVRWGPTDNPTSKVHTTNMTAGARGVPLSHIWMCEGIAGKPALPNWFDDVLAGTDIVFDNLFVNAASRAAGTAGRLDSLMIVIRGAGNSASPYTFKQWPDLIGDQNTDTEDGTVSGPGNGNLSTGDNDHIQSGRARKCDTGKYYFEMEYTAIQPTPTSLTNMSAGVTGLGVPKVSEYIGLGSSSGHSDNGVGVKGTGLNVHQQGTSRNTSLTAWVAGDILGFAVDFDNDTIDYYINNVLETELMNEGGTVTWDDEAHVTPAFTVGNSNTAGRIKTRQKASDFIYTPPSGFSAWAEE